MLWHVGASGMIDMIVELHVAEAPGHHPREAQLPPVLSPLFRDYAGGLLWLRAAGFLPESDPEGAASCLRLMDDHTFLNGILAVKIPRPVLKFLRLTEWSRQWLASRLGGEWLSRDFLSLLTNTRSIREELADILLRYAPWCPVTSEPPPVRSDDAIPVLEKIAPILRPMVPFIRRVSIYVSPLLSPHVYGDVRDEELVVVVGGAHSTPALMAVAVMHEAIHQSPRGPVLAYESAEAPSVIKPLGYSFDGALGPFLAQPGEDTAAALSVALGIKLGLINLQDTACLLEGPVQQALLGRFLEGQASLPNWHR